MMRSLCSLAFVASVAGCMHADTTVVSPDAKRATPPEPGSVAALPPSGPQSFTPKAHPEGRTTTIRQLWSTHVGRTDHRSTMIAVGRTLFVGTQSLRAGDGAGVHVIDMRSGARTASLPAAKGDVVGIAMEGDVVYSSSTGGEVAASTRAGQVVFRSALGAAAATPPTLVDVDGDGKVEVAVGDAKGRLHLLDGATGKKRWMQALAPANEAHPSIGGGLAAADLDGDGATEIVAGTEAGKLIAVRGRTGAIAWSVDKTSPLRAAPLVMDVDADKQLEVVAGWADGDVAIVDGRAGKVIWDAHVERDNGDPIGLLASPTPVLAGSRMGSLVVPTARWGKEDCVVLLHRHYRAYQSQQGRVVSSPVLGAIDETGEAHAIVGTEQGDIVAFDAAGGVTFLYHLEGSILASPIVTDVEADGTRELVVATSRGDFVALALQIATPPLLARARGNSPRNNGVLPAMDLSWKLP